MSAICDCVGAMKIKPARSEQVVFVSGAEAWASAQRNFGHERAANNSTSAIAARCAHPSGVTLVTACNNCVAGWTIGIRWF